MAEELIAQFRLIENIQHGLENNFYEKSLGGVHDPALQVLAGTLRVKCGRGRRALTKLDEELDGLDRRGHMLMASGGSPGRRFRFQGQGKVIAVRITFAKGKQMDTTRRSRTNDVRSYSRMRYGIRLEITDAFAFKTFLKHICYHILNITLHYDKFFI